MNFYNPLKRAEVIRPKMMKNGKYLIAQIGGSVQEKIYLHKTLDTYYKTLDTYFRYKDYMDNKEWFSASLEEIWLPKFIGLSDNFKSRPINEIKELEFQNPAYSAGFNLKNDPRNYSKVFTIQLAGCDFDCNYCYVPKQINVADQKLGKFFSAKEIIDYFLSAKEKSKEPMNVVRISGGNPTIVPEIIIDIYQEIKSQNLDVYLWIDSNLSTEKYLENLKNDLKNIFNQKNVGAVGCFKGTCEKDFSIITGAEPKFYGSQFKTAEWFLEQGTDFYVYLPALVYENNIEKKLRNFIERLKKMNKNLPLRVEVLEIIDYPGAKLNFQRAEKMGRSLPNTDQKIIFDLWHNKLLPEFYPKKDLEKYCCEIPL